MRWKTFVVWIILLCILLYTPILKAYGTILSDDCDACHGIFPGMMEEAPPGEPLKYALQNLLCVNCHSNSNKDSIKILGGIRVPVVHNTTSPDNPLAGGNFYYVAKGLGNRKGHNVDGIAPLDTKFFSNPPGYDRESDPSIKGYNIEKPLTCAGTNGCHGNRNIENPFSAIKGTHHADDSPIDGSTTAKSYRYLKNTDKLKGVLGLEDPDWGQNSSIKKHNEYSPSMNNLCANCHGNYYRQDRIGKMSPWFRHPIGIVLPEKGEYVNYNPEGLPPSNKTNIRIYSPDAPVARDPVPSSPLETVELGKDMVFCLSCHMAHAGPYDSLLRWDYDTIESGESNKGGCLICHTGKGE
ncbi:MAG: cytochrome c3 family protein [Thermodesulfovibrionales bacterium]